MVAIVCINNKKIELVPPGYIHVWYQKCIKGWKISNQNTVEQKKSVILESVWQYKIADSRMKVYILQ